MNTPHNICYIGHAHGGFTKHFLPALSRIAKTQLTFIAIDEKEFFPKPRYTGFLWKLISILRSIKIFWCANAEKIYWSVYCYQHRIEFIPMNTFDEKLLISLLKDKELVLSAGMRLKFSPAVLAAPSNGIINFHYGKLPQYRGTYPVFWQKWNNEKSFGYCFHTMDAQLDTGDVLLEKELNIQMPKNISDISTILTAHASFQLSHVYNSLNSGKSQNEKEAHSYTIADYIKVISCENLDDTLRIKKILNTSKCIILQKKYWLALSRMESSQRPYGLFFHGLQLRFANKDHTLFLRKINYLPAALYYWKLKKDLNHPDGIN